MRRRPAPILSALATCLLGLSAPTAASAQMREASFDITVTQPPTSALVGGMTHLVYELHLTNFAGTDLALTRIEVLDAERGGAPLAAFEDAALARLLGRPGAAADTVDRHVVAPGMRAVAYFWIPLAPETDAPRSLTHRIVFSDAGTTDRGEETVEGGRIEVRAGATNRALGAPLRGGPWVAVYDPAMERGHRRVLFAYDGRVRIPARFAIDWIRIDEQGRRAEGDASRAANHYGYGADVLAVADATVVAARDSIADRTTLSFVRHGPEDASGNYITLDLNDGRFISYEHLMAGSVRVAVGDRVRRGQVIAQVGYSGSGSSPHLHTHVSDGPLPLAGEGVPWMLEDFVLLGSYASIAAIADGGPWSPPARDTETARRMELPAPNVVVAFRQRAPELRP